MVPYNSYHPFENVDPGQLFPPFSNIHPGNLLPPSHDGNNNPKAVTKESEDLNETEFENIRNFSKDAIKKSMYKFGN